MFITGSYPLIDSYIFGAGLIVAVLSAYNLIMVIESMIVWTKNYKLQQAHNEKETTNG